MPSLRQFPPVHAHVRLRGLNAVARALSAQGAAKANAAALSALQVVYPGYAVCLTESGTSALQLALQLSRLGVGDAGGAVTREPPCVALPAFACPDVATAAVGAGFRVRLYDVDATSLQPDWDSLDRVLANGVSHVVGVHLFGRLVNMPELTRRAVAHGVAVIEDAAQHAGGTLHGVRGGALADVSILSFGRGKGINAGGGGAMMYREGGHAPAPLLDGHAQSDGFVRSLKIALTSAAVSALSHPVAYWLPRALPGLALGDTVYHEPGIPEAMPAASAALLSDALATESRDRHVRQHWERWYTEQLSDQPHLLFSTLPGGESGALRFPIRLAPADAESLAYLGVARSYPRTLAEYPQVRPHMLGDTRMPGAERLAAGLFTLPTHALLRQAEREELVRRLRALRTKRTVHG